MTQYHNFYNKPEPSETERIEVDEDIEFETSEDEVGWLDLDDLSSVDISEYYECINLDQPHLISEDEYADKESGLKQTILKYYPDDDVLTTEDDRPIENLEKVVGDHALSNFGVFGLTGGLVHVRNPKLNAEYRVVDMGGSYEVMVLGAPPKEVREVRNVFDDGFEEGSTNDHDNKRR